MSPALQALLFDLRQHAAFKELLEAVQPPPMPRYKRSQAEKVESQRSDWIYISGKRDQHDAWIGFLTGEVPARDDESSQQKETL